MLKEFIRKNKFHQFIHDSKVVDTRPWVCEEIKDPSPRQFIGIQFGLCATPVLSAAKPVRRKNLGYLLVGHTVAGHPEPEPAENWEAILDSLPNGSVVCCDQYTESRHLVGTLRFHKVKELWVEDEVQPAAAVPASSAAA